MLLSAKTLIAIKFGWLDSRNRAHSEVHQNLVEGTNTYLTRQCIAVSLTQLTSLQPLYISPTFIVAPAQTLNQCSSLSASCSAET
mgnify:CR=1 FL=1